MAVTPQDFENARAKFAIHIPGKVVANDRVCFVAVIHGRDPLDVGPSIAHARAHGTWSELLRVGHQGIDEFFRIKEL